MFKKFSLLTVWLALMLALAWPTSTARAFVIDDDGQIPAGTVVDDDVVLSHDIVQVDGTVNGNLIATGQTIYLNGVVHGDVVVNAGDVFINGPVQGNIIFTGGGLQINAPISGSVFGAGYLLQLAEGARVQRNLVFAGFGLDMLNQADIGRDAIFAGAQAHLSGRVGGDARLNVSGLALDGAVAGNVYADVDDPGEPTPPVIAPPTTISFRKVTSGLSVAENAQIAGDLNYTSPVAQTDRIKAQPGGSLNHTVPVMDPSREMQNPTLAWALNQLREFITLLLLGALAVWQLPAAVRAASAPAATQLLPALGWGVVMLAGGFVALGLMAVAVFILGLLFGVVTLGSLAGLVFGLGFSTLGALFSVFMALAAYGSKIVVACAGGAWLLRRLAPAQAENLGVSMALGVVLYSLIASVPIAGGVFGLAVTVLGLGGMWLAVRAHWPARPAAPVEPGLS